MNKKRDLVDFLILLECKKNIFYTLFALITTIFIIILLNLNPTYSFKKELTVSSSNAFSDIYQYQRNVFTIAKATIDTKDIIGRDSADNIIMTLFNDGNFYKEIAKEFIDSKFNNGELTSIQVENLITDSIQVSHNIKWRYVLEIETENESIAYFIHSNLDEIVDKTISKKFLNYITKLRSNSIGLLSSLADYQIEKIKLGILDLSNNAKPSNTSISTEQFLTILNQTPHKYSSAYSSLKALKRTEIPNTNIRYTVSSSSRVDKSSSMNIYLAFFLSVFFSIFLYLIYVLSYDLKQQITIRKGA
jgi:hypothetical protein